MKNADRWVLKELADLNFHPYIEILPRITRNFERLREMENVFRETIGDRMTKSQAVIFGLLARSFQLSISCLVSQLQQNYSGWSCSYRALMETFFVADWALQKPQRLEAYFEKQHSPSIGRIKADCCRRYPQFAKLYDIASQATHVETSALLLPQKCSLANSDEIPFTASEMSISGDVLAVYLNLFEGVQALLTLSLQSLIDIGEKLSTGEVLWEKGITKSKFGCLGYRPRSPIKD